MIGKITTTLFPRGTRDTVPSSMESGAISEFRGRYRFLSNFYEVPVVFDGMEFRSVEHAYQAAKSVSTDVRREVQECETPAEAKALGRIIVLRQDWEERKVDIMVGLVFQKFVAHRYVRQALLSTGDCELVEGNTWGDRYWGVCRGQGKNMLGRVLMHVREILSENQRIGYAE